MIEPDGYRPNVAIVLCRDDGQVFWAKRVGNDGWQFPQGGMRTDEVPVEAMYRELREETGLQPQHVEIVATTPGWLRYRLPRKFQRKNSKPLCIGQKQVWYLLRFLGEETEFKLDGGDEPEFERWCWVDYWYPASHVIDFKRAVYTQALTQFEPYISAVSDSAVKKTIIPK